MRPSSGVILRTLPPNKCFTHALASVLKKIPLGAYFFEDDILLDDENRRMMIIKLELHKYRSM